jgi:hypothetical protein
MSAGYSGTPLAKKLGLRPDMRVVFLSAPQHYPGLLGALPQGTHLLSRAGRDMDFIQLFTRTQADLEKRLGSLREYLSSDGMLWISWPKETSVLARDLSGNDVRRIGLAAGLVDIKVCAVDDDWSGLKFMFRVSDRKRGNS